MFSLVITIISLVLVVAFMVMTLNFSGMTYSSTRTEARSAKAVNEVVQLKQAIIQYAAQHAGQGPTTLQELVPAYLKEIPEGWGVNVPGLASFEAQQVEANTEDEKLFICRQVNTRLGLAPDPVSCSTVQSGFSGCCIN